MDSYTIIVLIFGILILFILSILFFINHLLAYKHRINSNFSTVLDYLEIRMQLIDEMITFLKNNLEYEKSLMQKLEQVNRTIQKIFKDSSDLKDLKKSEKDFLSFTTLEDVYSSLKNNKEYLELKEDILLNHDRIIYGMESYDKGVMIYNDYKKKKWIRLLSKLFRFPEYDYYNK